MRIRAEQLDAHIARGLAPLYVVWGDELLALEAADQLRRAARDAGFDEREVLVALPGFDWQQVLNAGANMSLFGGRKLIDLRIPSGKPGVEGAQALKHFAGSLNADTLLLLSLPDLDWQEEKAAWLKTLEEAGVAIKASPPAHDALPAWIAARLKRQGQHASPETLTFLAERVQGNLLAAQQEILKLALLHPPGELSPAAVREAVVDVARYDLDDLRAALLQGDIAAFTRTLDGLRQEGEALPLILWALTEEVRALLVITSGLAAGGRIDALLREARVFGPRQSQLRAALPRFGHKSLESALRILARADRMAKGVARGDVWSTLLRLGVVLIGRTRNA